MYDRVEEALKREDRFHQKTSMRRVIINELHIEQASMATLDAAEGEEAEPGLSHEGKLA